MAEAHPVDAITSHFTAFDLRPRLLALGVIGSESHGTKIAPADGGIDDTDYMGVVMPPARDVIGLGNWEHWVYPPDADGLDVCLYSLRKMIGLLLKSNPNVIGFLWLQPEFYVHRTPAFDAIIAERDAFSSKRTHVSFVRYAHDQLKKMGANVFNGYMGAKRKEIVLKHGYDTKNASHLIRLLRTGIEFLDTGQVNVYRDDAAELIAIKRGEWTLEAVKAESTRLFAEADEAVRRSKLPAEPDFDRIERLLMRLTREGLEER